LAELISTGPTAWTPPEHRRQALVIGYFLSDRRWRVTTAARLLRQARRARALSQRQLASSAREHQSSIADFERGKHDPGVDRLDELLRRLGYGLSALPTRRRTVADAADAIYEWL